jgi:hypothetical protein
VGTNPAPANLADYTNFKGVQIRGIIRANGLRTVTGGDWEVKFIIPRDEAPDILELTKAIGIAVNITITRWERNGS